MHSRGSLVVRFLNSCAHARVMVAEMLLSENSGIWHIAPAVEGRHRARLG